ncbi:MAG: hypothetical protein ACRYG4_01720, partial [Janthinobacterium lividum]
TGIDVVARVPSVNSAPRTTSGPFGGSASAFPTVARPAAMPEPVVATPVPVPEPVAAVSSNELDLSLDDIIDEPVAEPEARIPPAEPHVEMRPQPLAPMHPQPPLDERPMTLFEKMMNLSRPKPAPKPASPAAQPAEPEVHTDGGPDVAIPSFFKKQANN